MSGEKGSAANHGLQFIYIPEKEAYFVETEKLCASLGLDPRKLKLKLLAWHVVATREGLNYIDASGSLNLPIEMMPEFLESLKKEAERAGCLRQVNLHQLLYIGLQVRSKNPPKSTWTAARIDDLVGFVAHVLKRHSTATL